MTGRSAGSESEKHGILSVKLAIRDWLGIITLGLTMLGAAAGVYARLVAVETKVDMLAGMIEGRDLHRAEFRPSEIEHGQD